MQLSIIIVSYNVKHFLEQCLYSVQKAIENIEAEVWVTDNASADESVKYLKPKFPWVNFITKTENTGFARANNPVIFNCSGKYILFLNPDTLISEDTLLKVVAFMEANKQAGALGVRMIDGRGTFLPESKRSFPSPLTSFYKLSGLSYLFPSSRVFSRYSLSYLDEFKTHEVDVLSGAFMLVKKNLLMELKGFDEAFFMYGEDIDLSYRIQKLGWKNYYFSEATIIHFKGKSTSRKSLKYVKLFYGAMSIFVKKHYTGRLAHLYASFLHIAIWSRAGFSASSQFGAKICLFLFNVINASSKAKKNKEKVEKTDKIIVAGTAEEYDEVKILLANAGLREKITGRAATGEGENAMTDISDLKALAENKEITEIIFCRGKLSYSAIIDLIQDLPKKVAFKFHAKESESIVGSD